QQLRHLRLHQERHAGAARRARPRARRAGSGGSGQRFAGRPDALATAAGTHGARDRGGGGRSGDVQRRQAARRTAGGAARRPRRSDRQAAQGSAQARLAGEQAHTRRPGGRAGAVPRTGVPRRATADTATAAARARTHAGAGRTPAAAAAALGGRGLPGGGCAHAQSDWQRRASYRAAAELRARHPRRQGQARQSRAPGCGAARAAAAGDRPPGRENPVARSALPRGLRRGGVRHAARRAAPNDLKAAPMIIGTAGHIDHGKTTLVRALTGVDTDRLKEEKARGISIELGYAYTPLENGEVLGFIDVPGHERLVHTMVAGACGIDFALLVVAADDGVMPQTREHVAILELLGVARGAVALTKIDRVERQRLGEVAAQVKGLLGPTALKEAPLFALDATAADHPGTTALREHLHQMAAQTRSRPDEGLFRLAADRVFTLAGH